MGPGRRTRYAAPPGINSSSSPAGSGVGGPPPPMAQFSPAAVAVPPHGQAAATFVPSPAPEPDVSPFLPSQQSAPPPPVAGSYSGFQTQQPQPPPTVPDVAHHWFYRKSVESVAPDAQLLPTFNTAVSGGVHAAVKETWKPFTMVDSMNIEAVFGTNPESDELIPTDGGRFDVNIKERTKASVYWNEEESLPIRRCSWFYKSNSDGRWNPYDESTSQRLEAEYVSAVTTGQWNRRVELNASSGEYVTLHSPSVMMDFPTSSAVNGNLDDWGQVQPQVRRTRTYFANTTRISAVHNRTLRSSLASFTADLTAFQRSRTARATRSTTWCSWYTASARPAI